MNIISNINERLVFDNARMALINANANDPNFNINNYKLTQSFLRLEQQLAINTSQYVFPVLTTQQPITNNEQRLNLQDSFIVSAISFQLAIKANATDTAFISQTFPDPALFPLGAAALRAVYNSTFTLSVNNNRLLTAWPLDRHYLAPQQQTVAGPPAFVNQKDAATDGIIPMEPNIILVGTKNNELQVNLKSALSAVDAFTFLQVKMYGILAQNSTSVA